MRESKKSEGGLLKPPPPDRIGLNHAYTVCTRCSIGITASTLSALRWNLRRNVFKAVTNKLKYLTKYSYSLAKKILLYTGEYYLSKTSIAIVVPQNIFLSCSKIDLKILDRLRFISKTISIYIVNTT